MAIGRPARRRTLSASALLGPLLLAAAGVVAAQDASGLDSTDIVELVVQVRNESDELLGGAEVTVSPSNDGTLVSNETGEVTFAVPANGCARVQVILTGYGTGGGHVQLAGEAVEFPVVLTRRSAPGQDDDAEVVDALLGPCSPDHASADGGAALAGTSDATDQIAPQAPDGPQTDETETVPVEDGGNDEPDSSDVGDGGFDRRR